MICIDGYGEDWKHIGRQSIAFFYGLPTSIRFSQGYLNYGTPNMNRLLWLVCGIALLMTPYALRAQRRGGHGEGRARAPVGASSTDDLKDFKRTVALQASPDQVVRFRRLTESTQIARKKRARSFEVFRERKQD
jgi:hypothetical protein